MITAAIALHYTTSGSGGVVVNHHIPRYHVGLLEAVYSNSRSPPGDTPFLHDAPLDIVYTFPKHSPSGSIRCSALDGLWAE